MKPVVWGVLSTARIGLHRVIPAMQQTATCDVLALASRTVDAARLAASGLRIERAYGSYEALLADPDVEAVYNPLPNHLHVEWSVRALNAGKHVLCEKPIGCTAGEVAPLLAARDQTGKLVEEAFMVRDHPQWKRVRSLIESGEIGAIRNVQMSYSHCNDDPADIRNQPDGGGALLDVGCYCVAIMRLIYGAEPSRVMALAPMHDDWGVATDVSAVLDFGAGHGSFFCSTDSSRCQTVQIVGTQGWMRVEVPFAHPPGMAARVVIGRHVTPGARSARVLEFAPVNQYQLQAERFNRQIRGLTAAGWPLETAVANMRVLDAVREAAATGAWVAV